MSEIAATNGKNIHLEDARGSRIDDLGVRRQNRLTAPERATVNLLALGLGREATARRLDVSVRQVHRLTRSIRLKLDAKNDAQMAIAAYRRGLLRPEVVAELEGSDNSVRADGRG